MPIESVNPTTGASIQTYEEMGADQVDQILDGAERAYQDWRLVHFADRASKFHKVAEILRERVEPYAALMASEMGKPLAQGRGEVNKCAWVCDFYAENAEGFLGSEDVASDALRSQVRFQPLGVILAVMPWNFPLWQVFRFAAPALMAGNGAVLKHASNVPGCALEIEKVFADAGLPDGLFSTLLIGASSVSRVIENPIVKAVTLTGSTPAGKAVAARAGSELKKTVLELGGSDPYLILDANDLELTAEDCAAARLVNGGQSCVAAKRFIVLESIRERFESLLVEKMKGYRMGDPMDEEVRIGPQARHDLRDELHEQVRRSVDAGARLVLGGSLPQVAGAFYPPTVLTGVRKGMAAYDEEMFGPVASVISAGDEEEAVQIANDTIFGLGAAVYTSDEAQAERVSSRIEAGCCFINGFVRSDPRLPFGGIKQSGYGRELAAYGIREFVNIKTIYRVR